jgi:hypothetical protein
MQHFSSRRRSGWGSFISIATISLKRRMSNTCVYVLVLLLSCSSPYLHGSFINDKQIIRPIPIQWFQVHSCFAHLSSPDVSIGVDLNSYTTVVHVTEYVHHRCCSRGIGETTETDAARRGVGWMNFYC